MAQLTRADAPFVVLAPELGDRAIFALGAAREEVLRVTGKRVRMLSLRSSSLPGRVPSRITMMARSCMQFADIIELPSLSDAAAAHLMRKAGSVVLDASAPLPDYSPEDVTVFGGRTFLFDSALARLEPTGMRDSANPLVVELRRIAVQEKTAPTSLAPAKPPSTLLPSTVDELVGALTSRSSAARSRRARFALVAPFASSNDHGVMVYNRETGLALSKIADVDLVTIKPVELRDRRSLHGVLRPEQLVDPFDYDEIIHVLYNHGDALPALRNLRRMGGAVVLHDAQVLDLLNCDLGPSGLRDYIAEVIDREPTDEEFTKWLDSKRNLPSSFLDFLRGVATNVIVHSEAARCLLEDTLGVRATYLPVAIQHRISEASLFPEARSAAKRRCGLDPTHISIGTFGAVQPIKGDAQYPYIVRELIERGFPVEFYYVGALHPGRFDAINHAARKVNVQDRIHFADNILENSYMDHIVAMDVGVQLRSIGSGQVSGALLDCVAGCLPTVASAALADSIDAPTSLVKSIANITTPLLVAHEIAEFIPHALAVSRPHPDWRDYVRERTFATYAERLQAALII